MKPAIDQPQPIDRTLLITTLVLIGIGIPMVFDASYSLNLQQHVSPYKYVIMQGICCIVGLISMFILASIPYWRLRGIAVYGVVAAFGLLIATSFTHLGHTSHGASRWIGIGQFRLQPSELAKTFVVLYVAHICAGRQKIMGDFFKGPLPPMFVILLLGGLTAAEPDLGTATVIIGTGLATLYFAGMKGSHIATTVLALSLCISLVMGVKNMLHPGQFQIKRLLVFLHPEKYSQGDGYQIFHSIIAVSTGGVLGRGIGNGREKTYIPEPHTDFIFATLAEECGLIATIGLIGIFGIFVVRGFHIAISTKDSFGAILASGISAMLGLQVLINIAVVTSSIPATGVPLPFISYGGTSLIMSLLMVGILLNISRFPYGNPERFLRDTTRKSELEFEKKHNRGATLSRPEYREAYRPLNYRPKAPLQ